MPSKVCVRKVIMRLREYPLCIHCMKKAVKASTFFCTKNCALEYASIMLQASGIGYCFICNDWSETHTDHNGEVFFMLCGHERKQ